MKNAENALIAMSSKSYCVFAPLRGSSTSPNTRRSEPISCPASGVSRHTLCVMAYLGLGRHHLGQHRHPLRMRHRPVASPPGLCPAPDALAVGEVPAGMARPVHPVGLEVEPHPFGDHPGPVHHLQRNRIPVAQHVVVKLATVAADHHLTRHRLQDAKQLDMVTLLVVVAVAITSGRLAGGLQVRRIGEYQLVAVIRKPGQIRMTAAVYQLHRIVATEPLDGTDVKVNADVAQRPGLSPHDGTIAQMRLDEGRMRRHQRDQRLAQPARRLGPETHITHEKSPS